MRRAPSGRWLTAILLVLGVLGLAGCGRVASPWESGELVVLTRNGATSYFLAPNGQPSGFEYDLARAFAERQGWRLKIKPVQSLDRLLSQLQNGRAHFAAAGLAMTEARAKYFDFSASYGEEREIVVCGPDVPLPRAAADLPGLRLEVVAGSSHLERLRALAHTLPGLKWREVRSESEEGLLERVAEGHSDCAVADATSFDVAWNYLPSLNVAFDLGEPRRIAWAMPKSPDPALTQAMAAFFQDMEASGALARLRERYFGHVRRLEETDVLGLLEKRATRLPQLKTHFHKAQLETGVDWRLLAALAYQESQWNPEATSPTGVRGVMMLTAETADRLGVRNRLDPEESIVGGARYLVQLMEGLAARIAEPDRTWLAMAAYNVGMGHLEDARRLTQRLGKNPDAWSDVKDVLPLIASSRYRGHLRHGHARGGEARILTENVRIYYDILARYEPPYVYKLGN